jgi:hypothetical protein
MGRLFVLQITGFLVMCGGEQSRLQGVVVMAYCGSVSGSVLRFEIQRISSSVFQHQKNVFRVLHFNVRSSIVCQKVGV